MLTETSFTTQGYNRFSVLLDSLDGGEAGNTARKLVLESLVIHLLTLLRRWEFVAIIAASYISICPINACIADGFSWKLRSRPTSVWNIFTSANYSSVIATTIRRYYILRGTRDEAWISCLFVTHTTRMGIVSKETVVLRRFNKNWVYQLRRWRNFPPYKVWKTWVDVSSVGSSLRRRANARNVRSCLSNFIWWKNFNRQRLSW